MPASLRHVTGFPGLGLLRKLRPRRIPIARLRRASRRATRRRESTGSCVPVDDPWTVRRLALPRGDLATGHEWDACRGIDRRCHQAGKPQPTRFAHRSLSLSRDRGFALDGASDTSFDCSPWILR